MITKTRYRISTVTPRWIAMGAAAVHAYRCGTRNFKCVGIDVESSSGVFANWLIDFEFDPDSAIRPIKDPGHIPLEEFTKYRDTIQTEKH